MNTRQKHLFTKTVSLLGISAFAALVGAPGFAQSIRYDVKPGSNPTYSSPAPSAGTATTDPAYGNPGPQPNSSTSNGRYMGQSMQRSNSGPSAVGEGQPGPSETPSGSPSVPGVSNQDDPGLSNGSSNSTRSRQDALNDSNRTNTTRPDMNQMNRRNSGPSTVPGQGQPGASETPSGSPSVPGVSNQDDPGRVQ
jgi:hypothetical protein